MFFVVKEPLIWSLLNQSSSKGCHTSCVHE
jgi:hypothetical protein